jgi:predicted amidohydrolase
MPTICAVQLWSSKQSTPDDNRAHALEMLEYAARTSDADLIVLPEAVAMLCYPDDHPSFTYHDVSETIPGPTTDAACYIAAAYETNVVIGVIEERGHGCQNLAVVVNRDGTILGLYEKQHEPEVCIRDQAALEGSQPGLFDLDFGRIGVFICWDLFYPEVPAELAASGADLLVFPHQLSFANEKSQARLLRKSARETGLPLVAAGMRDEHNHNAGQDGLWPTTILDRDGEVLVQTDKAGADLIEWQFARL